MSSIEPLSGAISPVIRLKRVVLPAPLGPMISRRSPTAMWRLTPAVTRKPPNALLREVTARAVMGPAPARQARSDPHANQPLRNGPAMGTDPVEDPGQSAT